MGLWKDLLPPQAASNNSMRAPQIYTKFDQDVLFQIRISARESKINDMAVRQRRNEQTHPSCDLHGRCAATAHDRGRKMTGEGGEGRPSKAGGRGRPEYRGGGRKERVAGGERGRAALWGTERSRARGGERSGAGRGDFFSSLLVGPRRTNQLEPLHRASFFSWVRAN